MPSIGEGNFSTIYLFAWAQDHLGTAGRLKIRNTRPPSTIIFHYTFETYQLMDRRTKYQEKECYGGAIDVRK